jgi:hypothetical protein
MSANVIDIDPTKLGALSASGKLLDEMISEAWMHFHCTEDEAMCLWIRCWHQRLMLAQQGPRGEA